MKQNNNKITFTIPSIEDEIFVIKKLTLPYENELEQNKTIFTLPKFSVEKEYFAEAYEAFLSKLEKDWIRDENNFIEKLETLFNKKIEKQFLIHLSNYGPLGHYLENTNHIFININIEKYGFNAVRTVKHELIHLFIEPYIKKYGIKQSVKEEVVNSILKLFD